MKKGNESPLFKDLTDKQFSSLTPISYGLHKTKGGKDELKWKCKCVCGNVCYIRSSQLTKKLRTDCKNCSKKRQTRKQTLPLQQSTFNRIYRTYKRQAKYCKRVFDISKEEFQNIINKDCAYCGSPPLQYSDGYKRNGIDRIDSDKGYTKQNIAPCCEMCNHAKSYHPKDKFLSWALQLYKYQQLKGLT